MKGIHRYPVAILFAGLLFFALYSYAGEEARKEDGATTPYRYTALEMAEEALEAYQALETNDITQAKQILIEAVLNVIEAEEYGGSSMSLEKVEAKSKSVRDSFRKIYSTLLQTDQKK